MLAPLAQTTLRSTPRKVVVVVEVAVVHRLRRALVQQAAYLAVVEEAGIPQAADSTLGQAHKES